MAQSNRARAMAQEPARCDSLQVEVNQPSNPAQQPPILPQLTSACLLVTLFQGHAMPDDLPKNQFQNMRALFAYLSVSKRSKTKRDKTPLSICGLAWLVWHHSLSVTSIASWIALIGFFPDSISVIDSFTARIARPSAALCLTSCVQTWSLIVLLSFNSVLPCIFNLIRPQPACLLACFGCGLCQDSTVHPAINPNCEKSHTSKSPIALISMRQNGPRLDRFSRFIIVPAYVVSWPRRCGLLGYRAGLFESFCAGHRIGHTGRT